MKKLFIILFFITLKSYGQYGLTFDHRFVQSENQWVVIRTPGDTVFNFGFIYIDAQAGLTLNYEGSFKVSNEGKFIPNKLENFGMKYRLQPNKVKVAIIPKSRYDELKIIEYPDWLKIYLGDTNSISHLYRWGFLYNGYDECSKALTYLEKAQKINPKFKGLAVELAFSYNCLKQHDKAIDVLELALSADSTDAYTNKELIFALIESKQFDKAAIQCRKAISFCKDQSYNGENCYNLIHTFYVLKDKKNFSLWLDETKKWTSEKKDWLNSVNAMADEMKK